MSSTSKLKPEKLPPTEKAAYFHCLCVSIKFWSGTLYRKIVRDAINWGWKLLGNILAPIMTDESPAPDELLNIVRCNCQMTLKTPCGGSCVAAMD